MAVVVDICQTFLEKMYPEASLQQVLACVADAVFCGDSAYVYVSCVKKLKYFSEGLFRVVYALES